MNSEFAATRDTDQLLCRNLRHAWTIARFRAITPDEARNHKLMRWDQAIVRELECMRCYTTKLEFFARDSRTMGFVRVKGSYDYADGYLFRSDSDEDDRPDRWDYFSELLNRRTL